MLLNNCLYSANPQLAAKLTGASIKIRAATGKKAERGRGPGLERILPRHLVVFDVFDVAVLHVVVDPGRVNI